MRQPILFLPQTADNLPFRLNYPQRLEILDKKGSETRIGSKPLKKSTEGTTVGLDLVETR
jgi:hypothetical protein